LAFSFWVVFEPNCSACADELTIVVEQALFLVENAKLA